MLGTVADLCALLFCCIAIVACCLLSHLGTGLPVFEVQDLLTEEDRQRHANITHLLFTAMKWRSVERLVMRGVCSDSFSCSLLHDGRKSEPLAFFNRP